jgi:hypothetical protein
MNRIRSTFVGLAALLRTMARNMAMSDAVVASKRVRRSNPGTAEFVETDPLDRGRTAVLPAATPNPLRNPGIAVLVKTDPLDRGRTAVSPAATPGAEAVRLLYSYQMHDHTSCMLACCTIGVQVDCIGPKKVKAV